MDLETRSPFRSGCRICGTPKCLIEEREGKGANRIAESTLDVLVAVFALFVGVTFFAGMLYLSIVVPIFLTIKMRSGLDAYNNVSFIFAICALLVSIVVSYVFFKGLQSFRH